ncbi:hypothetical protein A8C56_18440 [Niabella ginsenosidivorans]|uniref:Uncharacterized protein n=1 Tax=Niabella ginsenosidivorans TaxID=1176587 RepID=A0A1A9I7L5_9BACT|nr:hypothetical protein [Niabella ginsenosidivorans]ANH82691.1 hypothetical protein A8C56_18440 [Niabella ginsenosidivorans]
MKRILSFVGILMIILIANISMAQSKSAFYEAMAGNSAKAIDAQLSRLDSYASGNEKLALEGALEMRKAGLLSIPAKKLSTFKQGHKKLEAAIASAPRNGEFRFLRLMIQENAPRSMGYSKNIGEDSKLIREQFASLPAETRQSIKNYSKKSKSLGELL